MKFEVILILKSGSELDFFSFNYYRKRRKEVKKEYEHMLFPGKKEYEQDRERER